jgi:branched-chain amino acid aminotransferase
VTTDANRAGLQADDREIDASGVLSPYVNGRVWAPSEPALSAYESGFNFADGVFEGIRVYSGHVFRLDEHLERLFESANALNIDAPVDRVELAQIILGWLRDNDALDGIHFRPIITRGLRTPPRLDPRYCLGPASLVIVGGRISNAPSPGIRTVFASVRRTPADCFDPKVKSLNYGNNLLARLEAIRQGVDDAIMLDVFGYVSETSTANIFLVKKGRLITPYPKACLAGITRNAVFDLAEAHRLKVEERDISPTEVANADEVFICATAVEIAPVLEVDGRQIGNGGIGEITAALTSDYRALVAREGVEI